MTERDDSFTVPTITFGSVELGYGPDLEIGTGPDLDASHDLGLDTSPGPVSTGPLDAVALSLATEDAVSEGVASGEAAPVVAGDETIAGARHQPAAPHPSGPQPQGPSSPGTGAVRRAPEQSGTPGLRPAGQSRPAAGATAKAAPRGGTARAGGRGEAAGKPPRPQAPAVAPPMPQQHALFPPERPAGGEAEAGARHPARAPQAPWMPQQPGPYQQQSFYRRRRPQAGPSSAGWHQFTQSRALKAVGRTISLLAVVWVILLFIVFLQGISSP